MAALEAFFASINWNSILSVCSDVAEIVTGVVATVVSLRFWCRARRRRWQLEERLKQIMVRDLAHGRNGRRTPLRLSADLGFTVAEILEAAFTSDNIKRTPAIDKNTRRASGMFLDTAAWICQRQENDQRIP